jgi:putative hydrolase of the HAD superfamily
VSSQEIGARKPEAAAFERVCERMQVEPRQVLFFDDTRENVEGACASGLRAFLVSSAAEVEAIMHEQLP